MSRWLSVGCRSLMIGLCAVLAGGCGGTPANSSAGNSANSAAVAKDSASSAESDAAWPAEMTIDLRTLQKPGDAQFLLLTPTRLSGVARGKSSAIFEHYRDALAKEGWKLSHPLGKQEIADESASALLVKDNDSAFYCLVGSLDFSSSGQIGGGRQEPEAFFDRLPGRLATSSKLSQLPGPPRKATAAPFRPFTSPT